VVALKGGRSCIGESKAFSLMIQKIISGDRTGSDRVALDWAIWHDIPHGGWCPKGRKAEDGPLPQDTF
jgi:Circularly permutated YpsA SLOG family